MALTDENGMNTTMLVSPTGAVNNGGFGFGGCDSWWVILLILLMASGGWGNGFGTGNGTAFQSGFDQAAVMGGVSGIQAGINGLATQICNGVGDVQMAIANGFAGVEQGANARQMANMQTAFAGQTAMSQGFNALGSQLASCCCENRLASADLKYTIATENCADRAALADGLRDLLANQTANTQRILDQLCQDKIDAKNDEIANLRQQIAMKDLAASQVAQNAFIAQGFSNEVDALYNRLSNCPVPSTPVYGRTPIFTCNNGGCGCGM